jgi:FkbM family methyltransferase
MKIFVEIGTCDFDTNLPLIESGDWRGLMCEPVPKYYSSLVEQANQIPYRYNLNIDNIAVSNYNGHIEMIESDDETEEWVRGVSHVVSENHTGRKLSEIPQNRIANIFDYSENLKVRCMTLDSLLHKHRIDYVDFLKIDVEGHELEILKQYSWRIKPTFIKIEHSHIDAQELIDIFERQGYIVYMETHDLYAVR